MSRLPEAFVCSPTVIAPPVVTAVLAEKFAAEMVVVSATPLLAVSWKIAPPEPPEVLLVNSVSPVMERPVLV